MFIALDENGCRISIENATNDYQYFCPICGELLIIRATDSLAVRRHFAHKRGTVCLDDWNHDMSEWHLAWQQQFPEQNTEVVIEKDGIKHRADVCINNTVIEFQHSPITAQEIAERNIFYLGCGYKMVWVFDATDKIKNYFDDSIDPMKCQEDDLCWKRAKQQFAFPIPPEVTVYLQYKTPVFFDFENKKVDIMLKVTKMSPKDFKFFKTKYYILPVNFLKEYGAISNSDILSVRDIFHKTKLYLQQLRRKREIEANKKLNEFFAKNRPKRRWRL